MRGALSLPRLFDALAAVFSILATPAPTAAILGLPEPNPSPDPSPDPSVDVKRKTDWRSHALVVSP